MKTGTEPWDEEWLAVGVLTKRSRSREWMPLILAVLGLAAWLGILAVIILS